MKRSEMVSIIETFLNNKRENKEQNSALISELLKIKSESGVLAQEILSLLEEQGMIPPESKDCKDPDYYLPVYDVNYGSYDRVDTFVAGWDDE